MQVVPATIVKNVHSDEASCTEPSPPSAVKGPLPSGVAELVRKKYAMNGLFDTQEHSKGLLKGVVPIDADFAETYHFIGAEPGQINIATTVRQEALMSKGTWHLLTSALKSVVAEES